MDNRTIFFCEDSIDGIFTAVYDAWASRLGLGNVTVEVRGNQTLQLFAEYRQVETDHEKAAKVAATIQKRLGLEDYQVLYQAALSKEADKGEAVFRTLVLGLAEVKKKNITRNLGNPAVMRAFELSRTVGFEAHRYQMFVRFRELENGVLFSEIAAENQVLPMIGEHFSDRFPMENFMIYDRQHRDCLVHPGGKAWVILQDMDLEETMIRNYSKEEEKFAALWKGFVSSIAIEERANPRCQMNFMPKKYWKYMTEHDKRISV
ncbi:MAG: TIGR03915 family putative DNA repair protein [Lachnospiraceae bacterium]|nr:TIGR03915 family putative DNA repair protein [Lachnospiraceae bacterium]MDD3795259.1 TIGR03915 family putative DNA repair protein [Lachnospiraceae bacterium]